MRRTALAVVLATACWGGIAAEPPPGCRVRLFAEIGYRGASGELAGPLRLADARAPVQIVPELGVPSTAAVMIGIDSVIVGRGARVLIYPQTDFGGAPRVLEGGSRVAEFEAGPVGSLEVRCVN